MKFILPVIISIYLLGCEKQMDTALVPSHVVDSLHHRFPHAENVNWKAQHDKYTAVFDNEGGKVEIEFNANGALLPKE